LFFIVKSYQKNIRPDSKRSRYASDHCLKNYCPCSEYCQRCKRNKLL